jgi:hypothetical protein
MQVIEVKSLAGEGNGRGTPLREIREYYSPDGELLARYDHYINGPLENGVWSSDSLKSAPSRPTNKEQSP